MTEKSKKILIVEDETPIGKALELKLSHNGYEVVLVGNGQLALDKLKKEKFDLMLLDLMMPIKGGYEVLEELKQKNIKQKTIILSNLGQDEDIGRAINLGVSDYFVKADTPLSEIVNYVKKVIG